MSGQIIYKVDRLVILVRRGELVGPLLGSAFCVVNRNVGIEALALALVNCICFQRR